MTQGSRFSLVYILFIIVPGSGIFEYCRDTSPLSVYFVSFLKPSFHVLLLVVVQQ